MRTVRAADQRNGTVLAERAGWCANPISRFKGLMLRRSLPGGEGIVLVPCNSVHMALMRFAIDVIFLDRENQVVKIVEQLKPYRVSLGGRRAHAALEVPAGTARRFDLQVGDRISFDETPAHDGAVA